MKPIKKLLLICSLLGAACAVTAAPYAVPVPGAASCRSDQVMQDLTDHISSGELTGDDNLVRSLHYVQTCQALLHPQQPHILAQAGTEAQ